MILAIIVLLGIIVEQLKEERMLRRTKEETWKTIENWTKEKDIYII